MDSELLTIEQVALRTGLSAHTLRYYERIGLLDPVGRATSGHRRYATGFFPSTTARKPCKS